jgi:hypothetical protein
MLCSKQHSSNNFLTLDPIILSSSQEIVSTGNDRIFRHPELPDSEKAITSSHHVSSALLLGVPAA